MLQSAKIIFVENDQMKSRLKNLVVNGVLILLSSLLGIYLALYAYIKWAASYEKPLINVIGDNPAIQKIYMRTNYRLLMRTVSHGNMDTQDSVLDSGYFDTVWDFNRGVALSKNMFVETDMYGLQKYRYRPDITVYNGRVWDGFGYQSLVTRVTPDIRGLLRQNKTENSVYYQTDENGFKKTEFKLTANSIPVFFLGDSFTEGLWVASENTFANQFGKLAAAKGLPVTPVNLGVNGYSALEESWMLEHYGPLLKPGIVVVNLYPNDVYANISAVIVGSSEVPEKNYQEMFGYLERMRLFCAAHDIALVLAAVPIAFQSPQDSVFQNRVKAWSQPKNILLLDPREYFSTLDMSGAYFPWDPHFTPLGHEYYAKYLYQNIEPMISKIYSKKLK